MENNLLSNFAIMVSFAFLKHPFELMSFTKLLQLFSIVASSSSNGFYCLILWDFYLSTAYFQNGIAIIWSNRMKKTWWDFFPHTLVRIAKEACEMMSLGKLTYFPPCLVLVCEWEFLILFFTVAISIVMPTQWAAPIPSDYDVFN